MRDPISMFSEKVGWGSSKVRTKTIEIDSKGTRKKRHTTIPDINVNPIRWMPMYMLDTSPEGIEDLLTR